MSVKEPSIINYFQPCLFHPAFSTVPYLVEGAAGALSPKTSAIVSFALCGFANLSSIAILLGGLGGMAPSRRKDIARFGLLAVMAGTMSNLMSGTIAGLFVALG